MTEQIPILILITVTVTLGLTMAALLLMGIHQVRILQYLKEILQAEMNHPQTMIPTPAMMEETRKGTPVTLEDLIQLDLMEQMGRVDPMTDRQIQEMVEEMDPALTEEATTEDLKRVLTQRATSLRTTAKEATTEPEGKTETQEPQTTTARTKTEAYPK